MGQELAEGGVILRRIETKRFTATTIYCGQSQGLNVGAVLRFVATLRVIDRLLGLRTYVSKALCYICHRVSSVSYLFLDPRLTYTLSHARGRRDSDLEASMAAGMRLQFKLSLTHESEPPCFHAAVELDAIGLPDSQDEMHHMQCDPGAVEDSNCYFGHTCLGFEQTLPVSDKV